ncbi:MAG TPA: hypothetical protein VMF31_10295 [Solirubrobacterales bacterium]|nr:hypothetical protein [Solirubrobacterales bacterium]
MSGEDATADKAMLHEHGMAACARIKAELDVDIYALLTTDEPEEQRLSNARREFVAAIFARADRESLTELQLPPDQLKATLDLAAEMEVSPNWAYTEKDLPYLMQLQGQELMDHVVDLQKRLERASLTKDIAALAATLVGGGILSVGIPAVIAAVRALIGGATIRAAAIAGIRAVSMATVVVAVALVLLGLIAWLIFENPKKLAGIVLNNTDHDFVVKGFRGEGGDLYMDHGSMVDFMQDNADGLGSDKVQIKGRAIIEPGSPDNVYYAGLYFADKNVGFFGAEGTMIFRATKGDAAFAHQFACPYSEDNGSNIAVYKGSPGIKDLNKQMYKDRKVRVQLTDGPYAMQSTVNAPRGGEVACLAVITQNG